MWDFPLEDLMLKTFSFMGEIFLILFFICAGVPSEASLSSRGKLLYALFGFSSLLFLSIALFVADRVGLKERTHKAWSRITRGPLKKTQTVLLTLSHYLAVTRSTCEVSFLFIHNEIHVQIFSRRTSLTFPLGSIAMAQRKML